MHACMMEVRIESKSGSSDFSVVVSSPRSHVEVLGIILYLLHGQVKLRYLVVLHSILDES
jgi:hypothetical protein